MRTVWTNIKLDEELDAQLFSIDPPEGFTVMPFLDVDMNASPATFMSGLLKIYAKHSEGRFPDKMPDDLYKLGKRFAPENTEEDPSEELMKMSFYTAGVAAVMRVGKEGEVWRYYPGLSLEQKDKVVFWVRDRKNKDKYMAVFGDLRVEELSKEQLPPAEDN